MNQRITFTQNPNGKLFADTFSDVRLHNPEKFFTGARLEVYYNGLHMGMVQVVAIRYLVYRQISDTLAFLTWGKPAAYLAAMLRKFYENETLITPETKFDHVVFQYTSRNIEAHAHQLTEWWRIIERKTA